MRNSDGQHSGNDGGPTAHVPVLLDEVLAALDPLAGKLVVDGTFGAGGYSRALLKAGARVIAIDRDPNVQPYADALLAEFPGNFAFVAGPFSQIKELTGGVVDSGVDSGIDAIVLDIGVSSMQLDEAERGFSFMREGPLDMRMSRSGTSAADLVNDLDETVLANLLFGFGEERRSRRIAHAIAEARDIEPIETTTRLAAIIEKAVGRKPGDNHPATRSFQALRIAVNGELDELVEGLFAAEQVLAAGGVLVVVTFHSLEDRIVKRFMAEADPDASRSRHLPRSDKAALRWSPVAKAQKAGKNELSRNPRARSAVMRSAVRTDAPARPVSYDRLGVPGFSLGGAS